jgi:hypothetical protein
MSEMLVDMEHRVTGAVATQARATVDRAVRVAEPVALVVAQVARAVVQVAQAVVDRAVAAGVSNAAMTITAWGRNMGGPRSLFPRPA